MKRMQGQNEFNRGVNELNRGVNEFNRGVNRSVARQPFTDLLAM